MNKEKTKTKSGIRKSGKNNLKNNILLYNRKGETRIYLILSFQIGRAHV